MAKRKLRLTYITNNSARKTTDKKRKKGMMKKLSELSTVCGIEACAIIYSPFGSEPGVWPSPSGVEKEQKKFKNMPMIEKSRKTLSQESYLRGMISKANKQLKRVRMQNCKKELRAVMFQSLTTGIPQFQNLNLLDMGDLRWLINQKLVEIDNKEKSLSNEVTKNQNQTDHNLMPKNSWTMNMVNLKPP
ncbi:agamous-like MADS-box protein AGL80 [Rosa rugosa]|uniref:agamous-like MADS-box protein AGL80 n=1 Tax=Rosa rugosa TaxID=74645 RepID=UPI002B41098B|nr:agamous-like MADS-box protein AGL80 [Rosa rugosa]